MNQSASSEENSGGDSDDATRLANGPEQSPGDKGLGASGAEGVTDTPDTDESSDPSDTRLANGPVQPTPGVEGLGAEGSTG